MLGDYMPPSLQYKKEKLTNFAKNFLAEEHILAFQVSLSNIGLALVIFTEQDRKKTWHCSYWPINDVSVDKIKQCEEELISFMNKNHSQTLQDLRAGKLTEEITSSIEAALKEVLKNF